MTSEAVDPSAAAQNQKCLKSRPRLQEASRIVEDMHESMNCS
jgi:hypothetical protein